jgi:hypothetical protein
MVKHFLPAAALAAMSPFLFAQPALAQTRTDDARFEAAQRRLNSELALFRAEFDRYEQARAARPHDGHGDSGYDGPRSYNGQDGYSDDRDEGGYDPSRYYREGPDYQERVLANDERVYRGHDGRYYCKHNDGTTGLIIGAAGGGVLGNVIDGGHSRTAGTLIGAAVGALAGRAIDQNSSQLRCR